MFLGLGFVITDLLWQVCTAGSCVLYWCGGYAGDLLVCCALLSHDQGFGQWRNTPSLAPFL